MAEAKYVRIQDLRTDALAVASRSKPIPGDPNQKEAPHKGRSLKQLNFEAEMVVAILDLPREIEFTPIEAKGSVPAYFHAKVMGFDIHLRDGLTPPQDGTPLTAKVEVKLRQISATDGPHVNFYWYMNVFPLKQETTPTHKVTIVDFPLPVANAKIYVPAEQKTKQDGYIYILPAA